MTKSGKSILRTAAPAAIALALAAAVSAPAAAEGRLNLYNWGDYINPEVLQRFSEEFDVEVTLDTYGTNEEMLAKIQAGATGYDIVFPSVWMHDVMFNLGLLAKTGIGSHPDFKNIDPNFIRAKTDPQAVYCLPYAWGSVGIVYNKKVVDAPIEGWADLFAAAESGKKIILLDDPRETIGIGHIMNGTSVNSVDEEEAVKATDYIVERIGDISAFTYDSIPLVQSGDVAAAHWYVGANIFVSQMPDVLEYVIPKEGATIYQEDMCVLESAPNKDNAIKFLEFYLRPEIAALNVAQQMNGTPNIPALELIPEEIANNETMYPPKEVMERLQIFHDLGEDIRLYAREWRRLKTAAQ
ncbi:spermidine/putrescine ABC transporter substrate-binding protein [Nitratireductor sp. ZSWI3]|uniref:polyamine ABC transporter substrate-binding protein n=1 Tax=Nitratireductor sp. ZSWI3 TaxID=2966359 RepID=UPI00214FD685|nr:spermidine/putrescine ABC transporter substrate-binding protein [Nitratireductor sp. ZSWI3]MCR4267609.1 spermidine/putrescine ABC transporter substrate-binding protein [Nitratireductor sp. ZSWI3]